MENEAEYCKFYDLTVCHDLYDTQRHEWCRRCIMCKHPDLKYIEYVFTNPMLAEDVNLDDMIDSYFGECETRKKIDGKVCYIKTPRCKQYARGHTISARIVDDSGEIIRSAHLVTFMRDQVWF